MFARSLQKFFANSPPTKIQSHPFLNYPYHFLLKFIFSLASILFEKQILIDPLTTNFLSQISNYWGKQPSRYAPSVAYTA